MNYIPISDSTSHDLESERIPISAMATNIGLIDITISSKYTNANQSDSCTYTMLPKLIISDAAVANVIMKEKKCPRKINTDAMSQSYYFENISMKSNHIFFVF